MTASGRLVSAFPAALHADAAAVLATMPPADFHHACTFAVKVDGEHLEIPYRIYNPEPPSDRVAGLTATRQTILRCLSTRHHDGLVRQRYVQPAIGSPHAWVVLG